MNDSYARIMYIILYLLCVLCSPNRLLFNKESSDSPRKAIGPKGLLPFLVNSYKECVSIESDNMVNNNGALIRS